jgi:hypothetical protein
MDYKSYYCKFLPSSLPLGVIKLEIYVSILGKTLFLTFKNQWEGESIRFVVSILLGRKIKGPGAGSQEHDERGNQV